MSTEENLMTNVNVDFKNTAGKMKIMHAVNNGPVYKFAADQRITNIEAFKAAGIPYARTHDASFYAVYGGEHTVDVNAIFPNFDNDPYAPESYDFTLTDEYLKVMDFAGVKPFYRLGSKIEHWKKKYNTLPPKDFHKWAVICEHIIKHFNEGWADGFHMNIEYWEIWNEPDLAPDDSDHKTCWGGTKKEFFEFYDIAAKYLKQCFPNLKIGGPALGGNFEWGKEFLEQLQAPLDFFSWHIYSNSVKTMRDLSYHVREMLDKNGYEKTESILDEWNYVKGWTGDDWLYSLKKEKGLKGSAFIAGTMCACQDAPLDMLMYYDARPCAMNGMFCTDWVCECLKGYYPFVMFNTLYKLGEYVKSSVDGENCYACAAKNDEEAALMLTYYNDDDSAGEKNVKINISDIQISGAVTAKYYLLDENHDLELVKEEVFSGKDFSAYLTMTLNSSYLIKFSSKE